MRKRRFLGQFTAYLATLCVGCNNLNHNFPDRVNKERNKIGDIYPDRIKVGLDVPTFVDFGEIDKSTRDLRESLSLITSDFNPKTLEEKANDGKFSFPQTEFEYFLTDDERLTLNLRFGGMNYHFKSTEKFTPFGFIKTRSDSETHAALFIFGSGIDYSIPLNDEAKLILGTGIEGHYYKARNKLDAKVFGTTIYRERSELQGGGSSIYGRTGLEFEIPKDFEILSEFSVQAMAEFHYPVYDTNLGRDGEGTRVIFYLAKDLRD
ncbi:MAG: hypothetical protein AABY05_03360 [Nanoarchaeota archaeon]